MSRARIIMAAIAAALAGFSCARPEKPEAVTPQPFRATDESRGRAVAEVFAEGFITAVKRNDFSAWQPVLPDREKSRITPEIFARMRTELTELCGELESGTYFGVLCSGDLRDHLWKLRLVRDGRVREVIFLVRVFRREGGEPEISGFGVKRF
ncbi:MAG: hypothetical protein MR051_08995 [Lentisphaeria bacterium]|nr:hypothetical protein [Lentisphaeria bacterium]